MVIHHKITKIKVGKSRNRWKVGRKKIWGLKPPNKNFCIG